MLKAACRSASTSTSEEVISRMKINIRILSSIYEIINIQTDQTRSSNLQDIVLVQLENTEGVSKYYLVALVEEGIPNSQSCVTWQAVNIDRKQPGIKFKINYWRVTLKPVESNKGEINRVLCKVLSQSRKTLVDNFCSTTNLIRPKTHAHPLEHAGPPGRGRHPP